MAAHPNGELRDDHSSTIAQQTAVYSLIFSALVAFTECITGNRSIINRLFPYCRQWSEVDLKVTVWFHIDGPAEAFVAIVNHNSKPQGKLTRRSSRRGPFPSAAEGRLVPP